MATMHVVSFARCFFCTLEEAEFLAECGGLHQYVKPDGYWVHHYMWMDRQTGGGGCRLVWDPRVSVLWISAHSGYPHADFTDDVASLATEMGLREADDIEYRSPHS